MNQDYIWDAVVVGAGVEGSSTAYNLSKNNQKTLLLEQFGLPHSRGSSHGQTRIIRYGYSEPYYSAMMPECFRIWHDVEKQTGVTLITETKLLTLDIPPYTGLKNKKEVLTNLGIGLESFNGRQLKEKYPMIECGPQYKAILENGAGVIRADKSLKALQELFVRNGGVIHDEEKYIDVFPGDVLTIRTNKGSYKAKCLILTVGPWAGKLLNPLGVHVPLKAQRINACYWREKSPGNCAGFPNFIDNSHRTYGIQITEYPNTMKVIKTKLCYWKEKSSGSFSNFPCFVDYTGSLVYGACPLEYPNAMKFPNVIIFFTGHGFKLAPVVGKVLSELAMKKTPSYDLSHFTIERFFKSQKSKL
ncbi:peroxisomal sarcosine oxidase-like [Saccoglossus kowalevskii]